MKCFRLAAVLSLCALTGCLLVPIPRSPFPLAADDRPNAPTVLLPALPELIGTWHEKWTDGLHTRYGDDEQERKTVAKRVNSVLETLAGSKGHNLTGPRQAGDLLKDVPEWEKAISQLSGNPTSDEQTRATLLSMAQRLGSVRAVYVRRVIVQDKTYFEGGGGGWGLPAPVILWDLWKGTVTVTAEEIDLTTARVVRSKTHVGSYWGYVGNPVLYAGAAVFKTQGHGLDEAIRAALTQLFKQDNVRAPQEQAVQ